MMRSRRFTLLLVAAFLSPPSAAEAGRAQLQRLVRAKSLPPQIRHTKQLPALRGPRLRSSRTITGLVDKVGSAIEASRAEIDATQREITALEGDQTRKKHAASSLDAQLRRERDQVQRNKVLKVGIGLLGFLTGGAGVVLGNVAGIAAIADQGRQQQIESNIARAREELRAIEKQLAGYHATKSRLGVQLQTLRADEGTLDRLWQLGKSAWTVRGRALTLDPELGLRFQALRHGRALVRNLKQQIALLEELRGEAVAIDGALDAHLGDLRRDLDAAKSMVERSTTELIRLVRLAIDPDPAGAVERWLQAQVQGKAQELLKALGLHLPTHIRALAKQAIPGDDPQTKTLRERFVKALLSGANKVSAIDVPQGE